MAYTPNPTWQDYPATATPVTASKLNVIESGIVAAAAAADKAVPATTTTQGIVQLAGDLAGTAAAPTVPGKVSTVLAQTAEGTPKYVFTVTPVTAGNEPFQVIQNSFPNLAAGAGTYNHSLHIGWNAAQHGDSSGAVTIGKAAMYMGFEDNYYDSVTDLAYGTEWYVSYGTPDNTTIPAASLRPFYTRVTDSTTNTAAKNVTTQFDIGSGPNGTFAVWGSVITGKSLFGITQTQILASLPLNVLGSGQFSPATGNAILSLQAKAVGGQALMQFYANGAACSWQFGVTTAQTMMVYDNTNSRAQVIFTQGATSTAANMDIASKVNIQGAFSAQAAGSFLTTLSVAGVLSVPTLTGNSGANKNLNFAPGAAAGSLSIYDSTFTYSTTIDNAGNFSMRDGMTFNNFGTTGMKFAGSGTQKIGFYGATPVIRPTATPAAATDATTTQALVNDLRTKLLTLGLIA